MDPLLRPKVLLILAGVAIVICSLVTDATPLYWADFLSFPHHEWAFAGGSVLIILAARFAP